MKALLPGFQLGEAGVACAPAAASVSKTACSNHRDVVPFRDIPD
jgi:hypothetical protein